MSMKKILLLCFILYQATFLSAAWRGYDIYRCGAKGIAVGGAFTAIADDVSALYFNPAGMVQQKKFSIFYTMDSQILIANINPEMKLTYQVPALIGVTYPVHDKYQTVLSLVVFSPFQRKIPSELAMYKLAPSIAMQIMPRLALGMNIGLLYTTYGPVNSPQAWGINFQPGLLYTPSKIVHLGLNYQSQAAVKWDHHSGFSGVKETFPDVLTTGAAVLVTERLILSFDLEYQNWKAIEFIENGENVAPVKEIENAFFKTIHPHLGVMFLEESSGAHLRTGLHTDSFLQNVDENLTNDTQLIWTIGIGAYAFKILKIEAALSDSYLMHFLHKPNNRIETVQITAEYRF